MAERDMGAVIKWLITGCILIALMVIIGGITRLTHSGLSIVDWRPIMGTLPPLSDVEWDQTFEKYKQSPEYKLINYKFAVDEFKSIFWWEYIHRLLGRVIGLVFFIPFVIFVIQKKIRGQLLLKSLIIMGLGGLQGLLGWYMVKSGLTKNPSVSHYRLAAHLFTAFLAFSYTLWVALELHYAKQKLKGNTTVKKWIISTLIVATLQIIYGAFVAGLKAGVVYTTFPKMGDRWIAQAVGAGFSKYGIFSLFSNRAVVQLIHRYLGISLFLIIVAMIVYLGMKHKDRTQIIKKLNNSLLLMVCLQLLLGIFTLIFAVPVWLGVAHQFGALILLTLLIQNLYVARGNEG